jgi:hypothetical protein
MCAMRSDTTCDCSDVNVQILHACKHRQGFPSQAQAPESTYCNGSKVLRERTWIEAIRVPTMARVNVRADAQRSLSLMFSHCFFGPTKKHVPTRAEMLPSVNMKMKDDLQ